MNNGFTCARFEKTLFVRVYGLANLKNTPVLNAFMEREISDGVVGIYIDLSGCKGMDSTFMGTLVGTSNKLELSGGGLLIVNPDDHNARLLDMLGVSAVIPVREDVSVPDTSFVPLDCDQPLSQDKRGQVIRRAHEHLIRISDDNKEKFQPIIDAFEKEMEKKAEEGEALSDDDDADDEATGFFV